MKAPAFLLDEKGTSESNLSAMTEYSSKSNHTTSFSFPCQHENANWSLYVLAKSFNNKTLFFCPCFCFAVVLVFLNLSSLFSRHGNLHPGHVIGHYILQISASFIRIVGFSSLKDLELSPRALWMTGFLQKECMFSGHLSSLQMLTLTFRT